MSMPGPRKFNLQDMSSLKPDTEYMGEKGGMSHKFRNRERKGKKGGIMIGDGKLKNKKSQELIYGSISSWQVKSYIK